MISYQNIRRKCLFPIILLFGSTLFFITIKKRSYINRSINLFQSDNNLFVAKDDTNVIQTEYKYQDGKYNSTNNVKKLPFEGKWWLVVRQMKETCIHIT
jgi:hypothetical protein